MKLGHRRTRSAIIVNPSQNRTDFQQTSDKVQKNKILELLLLSSQKVPQRVYNVEQLNQPRQLQKNFVALSFGQGTCKHHNILQHRQKYEKHLISIPQKKKSHKNYVNKRYKDKISHDKTNIAQTSQTTTSNVPFLLEKIRKIEEIDSKILIVPRRKNHYKLYSHVK